MWSFEKEDFERRLYRKRSKVKVTFVELTDTIPVQGPEPPRNTYDRALLQHPAANGGDWLEPPIYTALIPTHWVLDSAGNPQDKSSSPRGQIKGARRAANYAATSTVPRGKAIAELMFGFWSYLTDSLAA